ncbi:MAG: dihydroorotate dehydrogenase electron transfer subunit [Candidatus Neomarinimicrobiota bacterium]
MINESAPIIENVRLSQNLWQLKLLAPGIAKATAGPGQFIEILIDHSWERPLRRPMSIAGADNDQITIIYKTFGPATKSLSGKKSGEIIDLIGPLGNTFSGYEDNSHFPILVGGGVGLAPVLWLHRKLVQSEIKHILIIGAQTADEHFLADNPRENIYLTTDDGTLGLRGTVMPVLNKLLGEIAKPSIYACGPRAMLKAIQAVAVIGRVPAQLSVESYMACGIGLCQGCAIPLATDNNSRNYSLVCRDGPVYAAEEVSFA